MPFNVTCKYQAVNPKTEMRVSLKWDDNLRGKIVELEGTYLKEGSKGKPYWSKTTGLRNIFDINRLIISNLKIIIIYLPFIIMKMN